MVPPQGDLRGMRVAVLLNRSSGSCDAMAEATLVSILKAQGVEPIDVRCVHGHEVDTALSELAQAPIDALIVLGGDGTIRAAAEKCGDAGISFVALPGGTMNMLPKALYGERTWQEVLTEVMAQPHVTDIGGGEVEGHRFFCAGIFGTPSHWAEAREALRANQFRTAFQRAFRAYQRSFSRKVRYSFGPWDGGSATAVAVICPLISKVMPSDAPALEAAALNTRDLGEVFSLALNGLFSDWRTDAHVTTCAAKEVQLSSRKAIPALLDGELVLLKPNAEVRFVPSAFRALVPENSPVLAAWHEETV